MVVGDAGTGHDRRPPTSLPIEQGEAHALEAIGHMCGVQGRKELAGGNEDIWSLGELLLYGLKASSVD